MKKLLLMCCLGLVSINSYASQAELNRILGCVMIYSPFAMH